MRPLLLVLVVAAAGCGGGSAPQSPTTTSPAPVTTSPATTSAPSTAPPTTSPVTMTPVTTTPVGGTDCPEVLEVEFRQTEPGVFTVSTTVRSVDIEGVSYADAWEVRDLSGNVLGTRVLLHPHANEQPFTRSLSDVPIPPEVTQVEVDARDSERGFCGVSLVVEVPHS